MDHLPQVHDPALPPLKVLCLCDPTDYDKRGFLEYPKRSGWSFDRSRGPVKISNEGVPPPPEEVAAFLQVWLFFGLLHDVLKLGGVEVDLDECSRWEGDRRLVSTLCLRKYLDEWASREGNLSPVTKLQRQRMVVPLLKEVNNFFVDYFDWPRGWRLSLPQGVIVSILILGETLKNAADFVWRLPDSLLRPLGFFRANDTPVKDRFTGAQWCSNEIAMLYNLLDYTGLYLASMLQRHSSLGQRSHFACTAEECNAYQVSESTYETQHTQDCLGPSDCPHVFADDKEISSILQRGQIPVINIEPLRTDSNEIGLRVVPSSSVNAYVAISHVWAHGLGNPKTNSLPRCQLLRLETFTRELFISKRHLIQPALWIDTLCIPVLKSLREYRKLAITKLAETYSKADQVLVIDMDLVQASKVCSRTEIATRILSSGWMRRLWTLQEAVLTGDRPNCTKLQIQFRGGAIAFNDILQTDVLSLHNSETALKALVARLPQFGTPAKNFATLTHALEYRTTSRYEDEPLCLASILNLDVQRILRAPHRMQVFYSNVKELPSDILFHEGECLQVDGFRWAPQSLLSSGRSKATLLRTSRLPTAMISEKGLHVRFPGLVLNVQIPLEAGIEPLLRDVSNSNSIRRLSAPPSHSWLDISHSTNPLRKEWKRRKAFIDDIAQAKQPAVIMNPLEKREVIVVDIIREEEILYCSYMSRARLYNLSSSGLKDAKENPSLIAAREVPSDQQWCVG